MKKIYLIIMFALLLIPLASAAEWDNDLSYNEETKTLKIKNWLGLGHTIAEYALTINTEQCLIDCYAEGTAILNDPGQLFTEIDFETRARQKKNLDYKMFILQEDSYDKPIYETTCDPYSYHDGNSTINVDNCTTVQTGTEEIITYDWKRYKWEVLPVGSYTWRIEGKKDKMESIDWSVGMFGIKTSEIRKFWAWWNSDWNKKMPTNIYDILATEVNRREYIEVEWNGININTNCTAEFRVIDGTETTEIPHDPISGNATACKVGFVVDKVNAVNLTYYGYYDNLAPTAPSYASNFSLEGPNVDWCNITTTNYNVSLSNSDLIGTDVLDFRDFISNTQTMSVDAGRLLFEGLLISDLTCDMLINGTIKNRVQYGNATHHVNLTFFDTVDYIQMNTLGYTAGDSGFFWREEQGAPTDKQVTYRDDDAGGYTDLDSEQAATAFTQFGYIDAGIQNTDYRMFWLANLSSISSTNTVTYARAATAEDPLVTIMASAHANVNGSMDALGSWYLGQNSQNDTEREYFYQMLKVPLEYELGAEVVGNDLDVDLNSPVAYFNTSSNSVTFNCSATDSIGVLNLTLIVNAIDNVTITNASSGQNLSLQQTLSIPEGSHNWTCRASDGGGGAGDPATVSVRFFTVDTTGPITNLSSPTALADLKEFDLNQSENITWDVSDINLDSCWMAYNSTNTSLTCADKNKSFIMESGVFNLTFYANDTIGNVGSTFREWDYVVFKEVQNFSAITTEGAVETFNLNFTKTPLLQVSTVNLVYNATPNSFTYIVDGNDVLVSDSITIPSQPVDLNVSFYWNVIMSNGTEVNTSETNHSVLVLNMDNCSVFNNTLYNFTQYDEEAQTTLGSNTTLEVQVNLYDEARTILLVNFSQKFLDTNPAAVCLEDSILTSVNYSAYVVAKYYANVTATNKSYSIEYNNRLNETIGNGTVPIIVSLYNLKEEDTTKFRLTWRDTAYLLAPNISINVYRQYVEDNDFKIVEVPLTDTNGQTILNVVKNDIIYNLIMINEARQVVATFNSLKFFCQDATIGECTINLDAGSGNQTVYNYNTEFDINISNVSYNNVSQTITSSFITGDLQPKTVRMDVFRNNQFGNRSVCGNSLTASSGILSCDVSSIVSTDQFLFIHHSVDGELAQQETINLNGDTLLIGGGDGAFYAFLLLLLMITLFGNDKKILLVSLLLGWVAIIGLGLLSGKLVGFTAAGVWLLVTIGIFMWKLSKEES